MSRNTSPEEEALRQKLNELPLPDENASWQKMKALLDEKEKRRVFFFSRYVKMIAGVLLLCALLLCIALFLQTGTEPEIKGISADRGNTDSATIISSPSANPETGSKKASEDGKKKQVPSNTISSSSATPSIIASSPNNKQPFAKKNATATASSVTSSSSNHKILFTKKRTAAERKQADKTQEKMFTNEIKKEYANDKRAAQNNTSDLQTGVNGKRLKTPNRHLQKEILSSANDSASIPDNVSHTDASSTVNSHQTIADTKAAFTKTDSTSADNTAARKSIRVRQHNAYSVSGGIGIKQQLPVGNQAFTTYSYNGNKGWMGNYIPSVYIKLEKEKRWFVQAEFYYAAPRLVNKTAYRQITKADYGHGSTTTDKYYLQKTWYNQLPLSFNLYIHPSWSVGAGAMYNRLRGASAKRETTVYDVALGQTVHNEYILPWKGYTDSFLYKTNTSLLLQTDYHVKRWNFGLRYLQDVQPYLTYTLPDGIKKDKRNTSLEVLIRYELLRSHKFRLSGR